MVPQVVIDITCMLWPQRHSVVATDILKTGWHLHMGLAVTSQTIDSESRSASFPLVHARNTEDSSGESKWGSKHTYTLARSVD